MAPPDNGRCPPTRQSRDFRGIRWPTPGLTRSSRQLKTWLAAFGCHCPELNSGIACKDTRCPWEKQENSIQRQTAKIVLPHRPPEVRADGNGAPPYNVARVYDTWSSHYENKGIPVFAGGIPTWTDARAGRATNGFEDLGEKEKSPSDGTLMATAVDGVVDSPDKQLTSPPYPVPLKRDRHNTHVGEEACGTVIEVTDPTHPLFGRQCKLLSVTRSPDSVRHCCLEVAPDRLRYVPLASTSLNCSPRPEPTILTLDAVAELLQACKTLRIPRRRKNALHRKQGRVGLSVPGRSRSCRRGDRPHSHGGGRR